jgi:hypothetical protein
VSRGGFIINMQPAHITSVPSVAVSVIVITFDWLKASEQRVHPCRSGFQMKHCTAD